MSEPPPYYPQDVDDVVDVPPAYNPYLQQREEYVRRAQQQRNALLVDEQGQQQLAAGDNCQGEVLVLIERGRNLKRCDRVTTSDPYCKLSITDVSVCTSVCRNSTEPTWFQEFVLVCENGTQSLNIQVLDRDVLSRDDDMGSVSISINDIVHQQPPALKRWVSLGDGNGEILVETLFRPWIGAVDEISRGNIPKARKLAKQRLVTEFEEYSPGDVVNSVLVINNKKPLAAKRIGVAAEGKLNTHTTRTRHYYSHGHRHSRTEHFREHRMLFVIPEVLVWGDAQDDIKQLEPGHHVFPFSFRLPAQDLLPNFRRGDNFISYAVTSRVYRPPFKMDPRPKGLFRVCPQQADPQPNVGESGNVSKVFHFNQGTLTVNVVVDQNYLNGGGLIAAQVTLDNSASEREITKCTVSLVNHGSYTAMGVTDTFKTTSVTGRVDENLFPIQPGSPPINFNTTVSLPFDLNPTITWEMLLRSTWSVVIKVSAGALALKTKVVLPIWVNPPLPLQRSTRSPALPEVEAEAAAAAAEPMAVHNDIPAWYLQQPQQHHF